MIYDNLLVDVHDGAKPAGWGDDPFTEDVPKSATIVDIYSEPTDRNLTASFAAARDGHLITVQVGGISGWWWNIADVTPVGITA